MDEWLKRKELEAVAGRRVEQPAETAEYTGGSVSYYKAQVAAPLSGRTFDPMVEVRRKLAVFCCGVIARCLRNKTDRTAALLGYSVEDLRAHLESHFEPGMSWENYGKGADSWSIDHSRPISSFPMTTTLAEINALENLRPMWHHKNCAKKNKWEGR